MERELGFSPGAADESRREQIGREVEALSTHPLIEAYSPKILGEGRQHAVFIVERPGKESRSVVKVRRGYLEQTAETIAYSPTKEVPDVKKDLREQLEGAKVTEEKSMRLFERYFAPYALKERLSVMDIPVTEKMLHALAPADQRRTKIPAGTFEAPTLVTIQEKAPDEVFAKGSKVLQTDFLEDRPTVLDRSALADYDRVNQYLVDGDGEPDERLGFTFLSFKDQEQGLTEAIRTDEQLRGLLKEFVTIAFTYSQKEGDLLDFIGEGNARLYKANKEDDSTMQEWKLLLMDSRLGDKAFARGKVVLGKMLKGQKLSDAEIKAAQWALNYTRFMNALAVELGMQERLKVSDEPLAGRGEELMKYFERIAPRKKPIPQGEMAAK